MTTAILNRDLVGQRGTKLYEQSIRCIVETPENIGKMVIINIDNGEFGVDVTGIETSRSLQEKYPNARLFGIRIGYDVADAIGGVMERTQ